MHAVGGFVNQLIKCLMKQLEIYILNILNHRSYDIG